MIFRTGFFVLTGATPCLEAEAQETKVEEAELCATLAQELRLFGYQIDVERLTVESASRWQAHADVLAQLELLNPATHFEVDFALSAGLGGWRADSPADFLEKEARATDGRLAPILLEDLARNRPSFERNASDAASTAAIEQAWALELGQLPFIEGDRWVHPALGFSLPLPEDWEELEMGLFHFLVPTGADPTVTNITVTSVPNLGDLSLRELSDQSREPLEDLGLGIEVIEIRKHAGHEYLWIEAGEDSELEARATVALYLVDGQQVSINTICASDEWEVRKPAILDLYSGMRFGLDGFQRPEPVEEEFDRDDPPAPHQSFTLTVRDALNGEAVARQVVWIAPFESLLYEDDPTSKEEVARQRGRRFSTDENGQVTISFRDSAHWACARRGEDLGYRSLYLQDGDEEQLWLAPPGDLVARVVDQEGQLVPDVPLGLMLRAKNQSWLIEVQATTRRKAEASWPHVFAKPQGLLKEFDLFLTFAFPHAEPSLVPIRPGDDLSRPVTLTLPPTGSLVVRIDEGASEAGAVGDSNTGDDVDPYYDVSLLDVGDPDQLRYPHVETRADREFRGQPRTTYFPHIGLGLEFDLSVKHDRESERIAGPVEHGQRVEVEVRPGAKREPGTLGWSAAIHARLLDASGVPVVNRRLRWTLVGTNDSIVASGKLRTNEVGQIRLKLLAVEPTDEAVTLMLDPTSADSTSESWSHHLYLHDSGVTYIVGDLHPRGSEEAALAEESTPIPFAQLLGEAQITGTVLLPERPTGAKELEPTGPFAWVEPTLGTRRLSMRMSSYVTGDELHFTVDDLVIGDYLLHVGTQFKEAHPLVSLPVTLDQEGEHELEPIDLRDRLRFVLVRLENEQGDPVDGGVSLSGFGSAHSSVDGALLVAVPLGEVGLIARAKDYRPVHQSVTASECTIRMVPQLPVRLRLTETVDWLGEGYRLTAQLRYKGEPLGEIRPNKSSRATLEGETANVQVEAPGYWEVVWGIRREDGGQIRQRPLRGKNNLPIEIADTREPQEFELQPPTRKEIEKVLKRLSK